MDHPTCQEGTEPRSRGNVCSDTILLRATIRRTAPAVLLTGSLVSLNKAISELGAALLMKGFEASSVEAEVL